MLPFRPMLATASGLPPGAGWSYEVKWDGIRALVWVTRDGVHAVTRHGKPLTEQFPELAAAAGSVPPDTLLDGELVVLGEDARPAFVEVRRRMALRRPHLIAAAAPATLMVFDARSSGASTCAPVPSRRGDIASRRWICRPASATSPSTRTAPPSCKRRAASGSSAWSPNALGPRTDAVFGHPSG